MNTRSLVVSAPGRWVRLFSALMLSALAATASAGEAPVYTSLFSSKALKGYDAVAYFVAGEPTMGKKAFSHEWNGATWLFANADNRDAFIAEPEKYAPQYGGYCAWAVSQGYTASGDPRVWAIVDGKLYVNYNEDVGKTWNADRENFIQLADANWPKVIE